MCIGAKIYDSRQNSQLITDPLCKGKKIEISVPQNKMNVQFTKKLLDVHFTDCFRITYLNSVYSFTGFILLLIQ